MPKCKVTKINQHLLHSFTSGKGHIQVIKFSNVTEHASNSMGTVI